MKPNITKAIKLLEDATDALKRVQQRRNADRHSPTNQGKRLANMGLGAARSYIEEAYELIPPDQETS